MTKDYKLEDDLLKKSRPKRNSKRFYRLRDAMYAAEIYGSVRCEICGTSLLNPQSILIHQGAFCQNATAQQ